MKKVGSNGSRAGGNTNPPADRANGAKRWPFTWNNYPENWMALLAPGIEGAVGWVGGYQIAPSTGTKHIQGYVEFRKKVRPMGYRGIPKTIHWGDDKGKPAMGTREQNVVYCTREERGYEGTFKPPRPLPVIELRGWQEDVRSKFQKPAVQRRIYWYFSHARGIGKSDAVRWLAMQGALICGGKAADMKYLIVKYKEKHGDYPHTVVMDVPCSMQHYLSYSGIEEVVNGVFPSTKFECEPVIMPYARFFLFANFAPLLDNADMSANRFDIYDIDEYLARDGQKKISEYRDDDDLTF